MALLGELGRWVTGKKDKRNVIRLCAESRRRESMQVQTLIGGSIPAFQDTESLAAPAKNGKDTSKVVLMGAAGH